MDTLKRLLRVSLPSPIIVINIRPRPPQCVPSPLTFVIVDPISEACRPSTPSGSGPDPVTDNNSLRSFEIRNRKPDIRACPPDSGTGSSCPSSSLDKTPVKTPSNILPGENHRIEAHIPHYRICADRLRRGGEKTAWAASFLWATSKLISPAPASAASSRRTTKAVNRGVEGESSYTAERSGVCKISFEGDEEGVCGGGCAGYVGACKPALRAALSKG